jgi:hypothetical protein
MDPSKPVNHRNYRKLQDKTQCKTNLCSGSPSARPHHPAARPRVRSDHPVRGRTTPLRDRAFGHPEF